MNAATLLVAVILWVAAMGEFALASWRAVDRSRLATGALFALFALVVARALLPAHPAASWSWVAGVAIYAAVLARAITHGRQLPWTQSAASGWSIAGTVLWGIVLLGLTAGALWSLF